WEKIDIPYFPPQEATSFTIAPDSTLYICSNNKLYTYSTDGTFHKLKRDVLQSKYQYNAIINRVYTNTDTLFHGNFPNYYGGATMEQPDSMVFSLDYDESGSISFEFSATCYDYSEYTKYSYLLEGRSDTWSEYDSKSIAEFTNLYEGDYTFKVKARNIHNVESVIAEYRFRIAPPAYRTVWAYILYFILLCGAMYLMAIYRNRRLIIRNRKLQKMVDERTQLIRQHEKEIVSNINYASRIQRAILTPDDIMYTIFPQHFIIYMPHTIVSGDFYMATEIEDKQICVVADCTGHGVSGGFLSMLGISIIRQIVLRTIDPAEMLNQLREYVISSLHQKDEAWSVQDGMDASIFVIDKKTKMLTYAGANSRILICRKGETIELKGDRMPVGIYFSQRKRDYKNLSFQLEKGDMIYAFSDGYIDQFGGTDNSKFMISRFKTLLSEIYNMDAEEQKEILIKRFHSYKGRNTQTDDVLVMGVRID
ncbi:MAG: SpoIIE family protein phosphatase, partial [Bacteroidia bacterium]|nr:SpoIIE family protein phosphatase [Bacteroidia bacterium]